jgi:hypothetical protein
VASHLKFLIGDLVAYKNGPNADYLFGKDYGIVIGYGRGQENQIYYKIHWASDRSPNILSLFCYAQLDLIARGKKA